MYSASRTQRGQMFMESATVSAHLTSITQNTTTCCVRNRRMNEALKNVAFGRAYS